MGNFVSLCKIFMKYRYCFPVNVYQVHVIENKTRNMWAKLGTILQFLFSVKALCFQFCSNFLIQL